MYIVHDSYNNLDGHVTLIFVHSDF